MWICPIPKSYLLILWELYWRDFMSMPSYVSRRDETLF